MAIAKQAGIIIAGLAGDSGKSLVSLGLIRSLTNKNLKVAVFKKGPDFIDSEWLGRAAKTKAYNLDTFLMDTLTVQSSYSKVTSGCDFAVIEGNRGLYDGMDAEGSHSTAQLSKLLKLPVILVINCTKMTRTVAAIVLGCKIMDETVNLAGVILNKVGTKRQESVIKEAITIETGIPVLGSIPRLREQLLPSRHLGLVTAIEHSNTEEVIENISEVFSKYVNISELLKIAKSTEQNIVKTKHKNILQCSKKVKIGVLKDKAFLFYYPENLKSLEDNGAELIEISPLSDELLPEIDALYAGGGFPEIYAEQLCKNKSFRLSLAKRIDKGLPVWAECGGLMYLSKAIKCSDKEYEMVGTLPIMIEQMKKPQGHGYVLAEVDNENPFLTLNTKFKGHEFHYSRVIGDIQSLNSYISIKRGTGIGAKRDGLNYKNIVANYTHLHALSMPDWGEKVVKATLGTKYELA